MNGAEKEIFDAVKSNGVDISKIYTQIGVMNTTQKLNHEVNVKDIGEIKTEVKKYTSHSGQIKAQWVLLVIMLGWLVKLSMA